MKFILHLATALLLLPSLHAQESKVLEDYDKPFLFGYLGFDKKTGHADGAVTIDAPDGKGGAGTNVSLDLSANADWSPALRLKTLPGNKAKSINLLLKDGGKGEAKFSFDIKPGSEGFQLLLPRDAAPLAHGTADLSAIKQIQIQGTWNPDAVKIAIDSVVAIPPTAEMKAARSVLSKNKEEEDRKKSEQADQEKRKMEQLLAKPSAHPADGAEVMHIGAAAADLIGIELRDRTVKRLPPQPYVAKEGDVVEPKGKEKLAWQDGKPAMLPEGFELKRNGRVFAKLDPSKELLLRHEISGTALETAILGEPAAYRVSKNGSEPLPLEAVWQKSKVERFAQGTGDFTGRHFLYLKLHEPLEEGATYTVNFHALNTRDESITWKHDSKTTRSESIHVSHLGFRPEDPFKRAYLSLWAGTGGGIAFSAETFHLIDSTGAVKFDGKVVTGIPADQAEPFREKKNHSKTTVYHLDFSGFKESGEFRVWIPGLGTSFPFEIRDGAWEDAFKVSMKGLLHHRSGIELGPPFTAYVRPRPFHPGDGMKIFKTDAQLWDGESDAIAADLKRQLGAELDATKLEETSNAWGGYMDAGDWDRRSLHLIATLRLLELYEMFPEYFDTLKLALPADEAENDIPDLLDEALWNAWLYRRLQTEDGGIGGGVESSAHPRSGEASWRESLLVGTFRADPESSYRYAATAAKLARLLDDKGWAESARKAWDWATANQESQLEAAKKRGAKNAQRSEKGMLALRAMAAVEMFRLTGEVTYHDDFKKLWPEANSNADVLSAYLLAGGKTDPALHAEALKKLTAQADQALAFQKLNGFNLAFPNHQYLPMIGFLGLWSTPGSSVPPVLPRAHFFTGEEKYLSGLVGATQYPGGANPMNMTYTTGLGPDRQRPHEPLHVDSWWSGQEAPEGITVYGQGDPSLESGSSGFAHQWYLNRFGGVNSREWPTAEAYVDLAIWPEMTEYTVHQTVSPTGFVWGYLAASGR